MSRRSALRPIISCLSSPALAKPHPIFPLWRSHLQAIRRVQPRRPATNVAVQRVRFKRPSIFSWRRLFKATAYTVPVVFVFHYIFLRDIDWSELDVEEGEDEEEDEIDEEALEHALFIPLGRARKLPRVFYKGSDPEWQAFKAFSADGKKHVAIQKQLVSTTRSAVSAHKHLARVLGKIDSKAGRVMLSITFPDGPPQAIEIFGVYLTDNAIIFAPKEMSQINYARQTQALWPVAAFWSVYASSKYLFLTQYHKARQTLGLDPPTHQGVAQIRDVIERQKRERARREGSRQEGSRQSTTERPSDPPQIGPLPPVDTDASSPAAESHSESPSGSEVKSKRTTPPKIPITPAAASSLTNGQARRPIAFSIFMSTFTKEAALAKGIEAPRGSIIVSGLVEVKGEGGTATMDVTAAYDLKQSKYVLISMAVKKIKPRVQAPRGGP